MCHITIDFNLPDFKVDKTEETPTSIIVYGHTTEENVRCSVCGKLTSHFHGYDDWREVKHAQIMNKDVIIKYRPRRYICKDHDVTTTATPSFHDAHSNFTHEQESNLLLDLANSTIKDVAIKNMTTEKMIQGIVDRHISGAVDWSTFKFLGTLGIDEIALRKGYKDFVTVITCKHEDQIRILGVIKGRKKKDIKRFLKSIPKKLKKTVTDVCVDMYEGYVNVAKDVFLSHAKIIIDRYHIAKLYRKSLDQYRKIIISNLKKQLPADEYEKIKHVTKLLMGHKEYFTSKEKQKLNELFSHSFELSEAYRLSRKLTHIFNTHMDQNDGLEKFQEWIISVRETKLTCFNKFIKTLNKFKKEIANYFIGRKNSGFVEGFNNKIKVLKRRCYGIFDLKHLFQRLCLDVSGYDLYAINKRV